jgi:hypothetical protein
MAENAIVQFQIPRGGPHFHTWKMCRKNIMDKKFRNFSPMKFVGTVHCEAALASLAAFPHEAIDENFLKQDALHKIIQVRSSPCLPILATLTAVFLQLFTMLLCMFLKQLQ